MTQSLKSHAGTSISLIQFNCLIIFMISSLITVLYKVYCLISKYFSRHYTFFKFLISDVSALSTFLYDFFFNILRLILWPMTWSILVNVLHALQMIVILLLLDEVFYQCWLIMLFKPSAFFLSFWLLVLLINENGELKTPFMIVDLTFFFCPIRFDSHALTFFY